jgi:hypothetical protein
MKNYVLTFLLAVLIVLTSTGLRQAFAGIGTSPAPMPPNVIGIGTSPAPMPPNVIGIGTSPAPMPPNTR